MGARQDRLHGWLIAAGLEPEEAPPRPLPSDLARAGLAEQAEGVYRALGGGLETAPGVRLGPWDLAFEGLVIELDEALHFNRYRALTLDAPVYAQTPLFPLGKYRAFCAQHEADCLKAGAYGGKWTTPSAERQFAESAPPGQLEGPGAARWRQRAYYDFLKDCAPAALGVRLARISVWDRISFAGRSMIVGEALDRGFDSATSAILRLARSRLP